MKVRRLFKQYWPEMCLSMIDGDEDDEMKVKSFAMKMQSQIQLEIQKDPYSQRM